MNADRCIASLTLDENSVARRSREIDQEREIAIYDLLQENYFAPADAPAGPYHLTLAIAENRLVFEIALSGGGEPRRVMLSLTGFRRVIKDYFMLCESYYAAIREAPLSRIEAIDMGRRALHNEGSDLVRERLAGKIDIDGDTARRLFTLICALQLKV